MQSTLKQESMGDEEAAIKIQALYRGNKGRDRAVEELEALMEAELEYAVSKAQSLSQGKKQRKDNFSMEVDPGPVDVPFSEMGEDAHNKAPAPDTSKEAFRQHKVMNDTLNIDTADIEQRAMERVKRTAPGLYKKKDLIEHIKKLQERVADIQNVVEAVVPVVQGEADSTTQMPTPSLATRNFRATTNGRKLSDIKIAVVGLDGAGAMAVEMYARSGVGSMMVADQGNVAKMDVTRTYVKQEQIGLPRSEAIKLCVNDFAPTVSMEAKTLDLTADADKAELGEILEGNLKDSMLGSSPVDIVIDCTLGEQREALAELCSRLGKTRVEISLDEASACAWYRFHVEGAATEQAFDLPTAEGDAAQELWDVLLPSTFQTIAGLAVQNTLKYLMEAGKVTSAARYNTMTMQVDSREMSF